MTQSTAQKGLMAKLGLPQAEPPWAISDTIIALVVLLIGTLIIGTGITANVATSSTNPDPISLVLGWLMGQVVVFAFVMIRWRRTKDLFAGLRLKNGSWQPLLAVLVGLGGAFTASVLVGLLSGNFLVPLHVIGVDDSNLGSVALVGLFVLLVQPIAESLVIFGIVLPRLRASLTGWGGLLASIAIYAIYYYLVFGTRGTDSMAIWYGIIYPLVVGFTLGAVRIWSQSTLSTILAHIGVGASVLITLLVI